MCYDQNVRQAPFCQALHKNYRGSRLCWACDRRFFLEALKVRRPLRYRCHAGLTEFIVPVIRQGQVIALLQCGQVLDKKPSELECRKAKQRQ